MIANQIPYQGFADHQKSPVVRPASETLPRNTTKIAIQTLSVNFRFLIIPPFRSCSRAPRTHLKISTFGPWSGEPLTVGLFQDRHIYLE